MRKYVHLTDEQQRELDHIIISRLHEVLPDLEDSLEHFNCDLSEAAMDTLGDWCYDKGWVGPAVKLRIDHWVRQYT